MKRIATMEEAREYKRAHLWRETLDAIFDQRDHYRPVPASKVARMIDKAYRDYCELRPSADDLKMTVQDFSHRAHICGMRWPVRIPKGFPKRYLKKDDLKPMKSVKVELNAAAFEEFRALAEEADYPLSYYLHRVSEEIKENPELKKKIAYSYRKEQRQKAAQAECKGKVKKGEMLIGKIVSGGQTGVDRVSTEAEPSCRRQAWCALEAAFVTRLIETAKNGSRTCRRQ